MLNFRTIILSICIPFYLGCDNDADLAPAATSQVNENAVASTEQLLLAVEIYNNSNPDRYIVLDSIKNIGISINGEAWGNFHYFAENQKRFNDLTTVNNFKTTAEDFTHNVVLDYLTTAEDYSNAAQFAEFISHFLQPGDYFCNIDSLTLFDNNNNAITIQTNETFLLEISEEEFSTYLGKIVVGL